MGLLKLLFLCACIHVLSHREIIHNQMSYTLASSESKLINDNQLLIHCKRRCKICMLAGARETGKTSQYEWDFYCSVYLYHLLVYDHVTP